MCERECERLFTERAICSDGLEYSPGSFNINPETQRPAIYVEKHLRHLCANHCVIFTQ